MFSFGANSNKRTILEDCQTLINITPACTLVGQHVWHCGRGHSFGAQSPLVMGSIPDGSWAFSIDVGIELLFSIILKLFNLIAPSEMNLTKGKINSLKRLGLVQTFLSSGGS